jgi:nucleotide-binding universal stress UspA family protein
MPVVCGTDFSENAQQALRVAARLAGALKERLVLAHVVEREALAESAGLLDAWCRAAEQRLEAQAAPLRRELEVEARVLAGTPDECLAELAESVGAACVVVGFLGRRGAERWRSGSVPARLARSTPVPLLVVRDAEPFEAAASGERRLRVLVAADFSLASDVAVGWLPWLLRLGRCDVVLLHVYDPVREWSRLGLAGRPASEGSGEIESILLQDLQERTKTLVDEHGAQVRVLASLEWAADTLAQLAEREPFDVIVLGGHSRKGLARILHDSVSERILGLAPASVVRVPLTAAALDRRPLPRVARVLAPTDLSELGNAAVRYAYAIAPAGGTVHLLHVLEDESVPNPLYAHYSPGRRPTAEERAALERGAEAALEALAPEEAERRGVTTETHVLRGGRAADAILALAESASVDVICMGTHGRSGLSRLLGGSVAREVAASSPRPLFLVHPAAVD